MGKYFKYAIGEILLVVIGILLALQINTWNQERLDNKDKAVLLKNLNAEFEINKKELSQIIASYKSSKAAGVALQGYIGKEETVEKKVIDSLVDAVFPTVDYNPSDNAINSIVQTGKLNLLDNAVLSNKIADWKSKIHIVQSREEKIERHIFNRFIPYLDKYISWRNVGLVSNYNWSSASPLKTNYQYIFNDLEFDNILENHIYYLDKSLQRNMEAFNIAEDIINFTARND